MYSSIHRQQVIGRIFLTWTGLAGDQPTNTQARPEGGQIHGGHDKAVYVYPIKHYRAWGRFGQGILNHELSFGENFRVQGPDENTVHIGDIWRIGDVELEVSGVRTPGQTLAIYLREPQIVKMMWDKGFCGWYMKVKTPGEMPTTGTFTVTSNPDGPTVAEAFATRKRRL